MNAKICLLILFLVSSVSASKSVSQAEKLPADNTETIESVDETDSSSTSQELPPLRIKTVYIWPFTKATLIPYEKATYTNDYYEGYTKDLAQLIADKMGRDYVLSLPPDWRYGNQNATGHWNGMVGSLLRGEGDLAIADFTITARRLEAIDFSLPFLSSGITLMVSKKYLQATQNDPTGIKSIEDLGQRLLAGSELPVNFGTLENGSVRRFFESTKFPHLRAIGEYLEANPQNFLSNTTVAGERVRASPAVQTADGQKPFIYVTESWWIDYQAGFYPCGIQRLGPIIDEKFYGVGVQKNNYAFLTQINKIIMELRETGKLEKLHRKWWAPDSRCGSS